MMLLLRLTWRQTRLTKADQALVIFWRLLVTNKFEQTLKNIRTIMNNPIRNMGVNSKMTGIRIWLGLDWVKSRVVETCYEVSCQFWIGFINWLSKKSLDEILVRLNGRVNSWLQFVWVTSMLASPIWSYKFWKWVLAFRRSSQMWVRHPEAKLSKEIMLLYSNMCNIAHSHLVIVHHSKDIVLSN